VGQGCGATFDRGFCGMIDVVLGSAMGEMVGGVHSGEVEVEDSLRCGMWVV
jgi:hypothetical protein